MKIHIRPRINRTTSLNKEEVFEKFRIYIKSKDEVVQGAIVQNHIIIKMPKSVSHTWSPELNLRVYESEFDNTTKISGIIGPRPSVWTLFMFLYFFFGLVVLFTLMFASSQLTLGKNPWGFFVVGVGVIGIVFSFIASQYGQRKAEDQILHLASVLDKALGTQEKT